MAFDVANYLKTPPAVQPQGAVQLNRAHPLAPLRGVYLQEKTYAGLRDLVSGQVFDSTGTTRTSELSAYGRRVRFGTSTAHTAKVDMPTPTLSSMTMVVGATSSNSANSRIAEFYTSSAKTTTSMRVYNNGATLALQIDRATTGTQWMTPASSVPGSGARNVYVIIWDGGLLSTSCKIYINGVIQTLTHTVGSGAQAAAANYMVVGNRAAGDRPLVGAIDFLWMDSYARSEAEALSIAYAPHQMLERVLPPMIGVTVSAAPSSFNAAWARNSNIMIGARLP